MIEIKNILDVEKYIGDMRVVIFDLDDTLYPEKEYVKSGYTAIAKEYPQIKNMSERLWSAFLEGKQAIDYVLDQENLIGEKDNCLKIYRYHTPQIHFFDGVKEMLLRIKKTKMIGIITDGRPEGQKAKIDALRLGEFANKIIITDELGGSEFRKPNTRAFEIMQDFFKCHFSEMCYIGDNIKKDRIAPEKLGMTFIHFGNKEGLYR